MIFIFSDISSEISAPIFQVYQFLVTTDIFQIVTERIRLKYDFFQKHKNVTESTVLSHKLSLENNQKV